MSINREDVFNVAYEYKKYPLSEKQISYCIVEFDRKVDEDPTGDLPTWIAQLLEECILYTEDSDEFIDDMIQDLVECLKAEYSTGEVTSGEWITGQQIPVRNSDGYIYTNFIIMSAVNQFLLWDAEDDGNHNTVGIRLVGANCTTNHDGDYWLVYELDEVMYDGVRYPVRVFNVTHSEDDFEHTYMVAPESLNDAMVKKEGEDATVTIGTEAHAVDENIYHYVEDCVFYEDAEYICRECLDIPMNLINEEIL